MLLAGSGKSSDAYWGKGALPDRVAGCGLRESLEASCFLNFVILMTPPCFCFPAACLILFFVLLDPVAGRAAGKVHRSHTITQAQAERIALSEVPGARVRSAQLQAAKGQRFWSVDVARPGSKNAREVHVDARTGKVLSVQTERPEDQAEEPLKGR